LDITALKKAGIVFTTIELINEFGFHGVATREVARRQGISQGTVFQYFPKKNDLLIAVLDHFSLYDKDLFNSTKLRKLSPKEAVIYYIDAYAAYCEKYPAITAVNQAFEVLQRDPELGDKVKGIYHNRFRYMKELIEEAQIAGIINQEADSETLADILTSTQRGISLKWRIEGYNFSLREKTLQAVHMLFDAFG
jgi:AcrR family transcriptional regulator